MTDSKTRLVLHIFRPIVDEERIELQDSLRDTLRRFDVERVHYDEDRKSNFGCCIFSVSKSCSVVSVISETIRHVREIASTQSSGQFKLFKCIDGEPEVARTIYPVADDLGWVNVVEIVRPLSEATYPEPIKCLRKTARKYRNVLAGNEDLMPRDDTSAVADFVNQLSKSEKANLRKLYQRIVNQRLDEWVLIWVVEPGPEDLQTEVVRLLAVLDILADFGFFGTKDRDLFDGQFVWRTGPPERKLSPLPVIAPYPKRLVYLQANAEKYHGCFGPVSNEPPFPDEKSRFLSELDSEARESLTTDYRSILANNDLGWILKWLSSEGQEALKFQVRYYMAFLDLLNDAGLTSPFTRLLDEDD